MARYLYSELGSMVNSWYSHSDCSKSQSAINAQFADEFRDKIESLVKQHMPSGSGFDAGTRIDFNVSHAEKLVFTTSFHHMNETGYYDGWTEHTITVTPSLANHFNLRISGRNRNDIKDMIYEQFQYCLMTDVEWDIMQEWQSVKALQLEIFSEWIDHKQILTVRQNGAVIYNASEVLAVASTYIGSPIELCRQFCVSYAHSQINNHKG